MPHPPTDDELLCRIAAGDQDALADLACCYHQALGRYITSLMGGATMEIEDILQDVYLAVWRGAATYRGEAQVRTWLFHIAHNCAFNARKAQARRLLGQADSLDDMTVTLPSPEDVVTTTIDLTNALHRLSPKHRTVLVLVCQQGFTIDETAQILAIPPGTVRSRLTYARRALLQQLGKESIHD
jgi:RNA polymerase sigma-70 factor (ECF subfamily)